MIFSKPKLFLLEALVGFTVGILFAFALFGRKPVTIPAAIAGETTFEEPVTSTNKLLELERYISQNVNATLQVDTSCNTELPDVIEDISRVVNRTSKPGPSLEEDWGNVTCPITKLPKDNQTLFDYISVVTMPCRKKVMIGGRLLNFFDGEKWACLDKDFKFKKGHCTALSFGIASDWTFDDAMDTIYGCKVFSFDPTIHRADYNRTKNIRFFKLGISDRPGKMKGGKLLPYSSILDMLNLTNTVIDYLKMDVEGSEFPFLRDVLTRTPNLLKNVRQLGMEIHLPGRHKEAWRWFQQLDCLGFKVMFINFNPVVPITIVNGKRRAPLYEIVWAQDRKW